MEINNEAKNILGEKKLRLARELSSALKNKTTAESLKIIMHYMPLITEGKPLSNYEKGIVIEALKKNMNEGEILKLNQILSVVQSAGF